MKKILLVLMSLVSISLMGQEAVVKSGFSIKKISVYAGEDLDMVYGLDYKYFTEQISNDVNFPLQGVEFAESDLTSGVCENPSLGFEITLAHSKFKNVEWRNSVNYMKNRIDAIQYSNNDYWDADYRHVSFTNFHNEIAIESSLIYDKKIGPLHLYAGAGTNMGITTNNRMSLSGDIIRNSQDMPNGDALVFPPSQTGESFEGLGFDTAPVFTQRLFMQGGLGLVILKRVELGAEFRRGIGYRTLGSTVRGTHLTGFQLRVGYRL